MSKGICKCNMPVACRGECILKKPKVNSTLRHVYCMEELQCNLPAVPKCAKAVVINPPIPCQITKMMNFHNNHTVFKNLIPLNVNDSFVGPQKSSSTKIQCKTKMPTPNLHDYVQPVESLVNIVCEPDITPEQYEKHVDVTSSYFSFIE